MREADEVAEEIGPVDELPLSEQWQDFTGGAL